MIKHSLLWLITLLASCTKLPEVPSSSKVSYYVNGTLVENFYSNNTFEIETSKTDRINIYFLSLAPTTALSMDVVSPKGSIKGEYTFENSIKDDTSNTLFYTSDALGDFNNKNCPSSDFILTIDSYYPGQQTISGSFKGTVCNKDGESLSITNGIFEFVKQY